MRPMTEPSHSSSDPGVRTGPASRHIHADRILARPGHTAARSSHARAVAPRSGARDETRRMARMPAHSRAHRNAPGVTCPHCGGVHTQRWGRYRGRRRHRCRACGRTFSDLTGTPLAYLKRLDCWADFCACLIRGTSVRHTARQLGIHKDTAFRWRHRLLAALLADEHGLLRGVVVTEETWFAHSEKGSRRLRRPPRRRGVRGLAFQQPAVARVLVAVDPRRTAAGAVVGANRPHSGNVAALLEGRLADDALLTSREGPASAVARFTRANGVAWRRRSASDRITITFRERGRVRPGCDPDAPWGSPVDPGAVYVWRLRNSLNRFRGVATRYLPHYLLWFRLVDPPRSPARLRDHVMVGRFP